MGSKRIWVALGVGVAAFVGAGTLAQWTNDLRTGASPVLPLAQASINNARNAIEALPKQLAPAGGLTLPKPTNVDTAAKLDKTTLAQASDARTSQPARFVELKLNTTGPQLLAGTAPRGAIVELLKDGLSIATTTTSPNGIWKMSLDPPITDKKYSIALQYTPESGAAILPVPGQGASVKVDAEGRATITITPPALSGETPVAATKPKNTESQSTSDATSSTPSDTDVAATTPDPEEAATSAAPEDSNTQSGTPAKTVATDAQDGTTTQPTGSTDTAKQTTVTDQTPHPAGRSVTDASTSDSETKTGSPSSDLTTAANTASQTDTSDVSKSQGSPAQAQTAAAPTETDQKAATPSASEPQAPQDGEPGLLDGLLDQASRMAEAATEKFTDVLGNGKTGETQTPANTSANNQPKTPSAQQDRQVATAQPATSSEPNTLTENEKPTPVDTSKTQGSPDTPSQKPAAAPKTPEVSGAQAEDNTTTDATTTSAADTSTPPKPVKNTPAQTAPQTNTRTTGIARENRRQRTKRGHARLRKVRRRARRAARVRKAQTAARPGSPYIRNRSNGPWAGVRVTRLKQAATKARTPGVRHLQRRIRANRSKYARHVRRVQ